DRRRRVVARGLQFLPALARHRRRDLDRPRQPLLACRKLRLSRRSRRRAQRGAAPRPLRLVRDQTVPSSLIAIVGAMGALSGLARSPSRILRLTAISASTEAVPAIACGV